MNVKFLAQGKKRLAMTGYIPTFHTVLVLLTDFFVFTSEHALLILKKIQLNQVAHTIISFIYAVSINTYLTKIEKNRIPKESPTRQY
jgi:hypothetical protein